MFGKHLEEAEAKVLFIEMDTHTRQMHNSAAEPRELFEVILDVHPRNGQIFRTSIKQHFNPYHSPNVGDVVKVQYNPKNKEVKVETKGDIRYDQHARELARKARHDAILAAPAGTPVQANIQNEDDELTELIRLEIEEHQRMHDELLHSGSQGSATVLSINEMNANLPPLVGYLIDVEVRPLLGGAPFTRSLAAWFDPRTHAIVPGSTVQVRYDPQDTSHITLE